MGPDFSLIDSEQKAQQLCAQGSLVRMLLLPAAFSGSDIPENVVYVPAWLASAKEGIDLNIVRPLILDGTVEQYSATPEYDGESFVPVAVRISAWHPNYPDGGFSSTLGVWGIGLST